jgi:protein ImuB
MASFRQTSSTEIAPGLRESRRYLVLHLPRWATDCLKRADPALAASKRPLVLWEKQRGAMKLVALDEKASAAGLFVSQNLSDARAIVPDLEAREIDRDYLTRVFEDFADWHSNASPIVAVLTHNNAWGDLALDITGVSHLFGGELQMLDRLTRRLAALGYTVHGAIASTLGVATALSLHFPGRVLAEGMESRALASLPVSSLRLEPDQVESLKQFGLKSIGQLYDRDRRALQARFGTSLLLRLDQALGWIEEKVAPRIPIADYTVERRFAEPIALIEDVLMTAHDLAITLAHILGTNGLGAQAFHLFLYRVDHKVMTLSVNAARATRDASHIGRLFSYRAERLEGEYDAGFGIDMIRLAASSTSPLDAVQAGAFGSDDGATLDGLYDRMSSRLGLLSVVRSEAVNSHIPEVALRLAPAIAVTPPAKEPPPAVITYRPLRLLPSPEPITVIAEVPDAPPSQMIWRRVAYRFVKASGPERVSAEWHHLDLRLQLTQPSIEAALITPERFYAEGHHTRDYYIAEDEGGRRFWLVRSGLLGISNNPRWFLQGLFA